MPVVSNRRRVNQISVIGLVVWASLFQTPALQASEAIQRNRDAAAKAGTDSPTPADPYPLIAAGWGPEVGNGLFASRWAEDWRAMQAAGNAPALKAMSLGPEASLTLSAEARVRSDVYNKGQLKRGNDYSQGLFRGILGADLHLNQNVRLYGEVGTGLTEGRRAAAAANFQNAASIQQLFVDARQHIGSTLVGAMLGRQEFADGPRQLISLSDGPNIHRTWNGVRGYVHGERQRIGAFDLRVTRLMRGAFGEKINHAERIQGVNASQIVSSGDVFNTYIDPFWIRSKNPSFRYGSHVGLDDRDTLGVRAWGRTGRLRFDWTLARQSGNHIGREVNAWALFMVHSVLLSNDGWKPSFTAHIDAASGGGAFGTDKLNGFNPLYASSSYLGDGQFLSLSNLLMIAPGISVSPTPMSNVSIEYGFARRRNEADAAYAGGMRAYAGTQNVRGHEIGDLLRVVGSWSVSKHLTWALNYEQFAAGDVLKRAGLPSGSYLYVSATLRY